MNIMGSPHAKYFQKAVGNAHIPERRKHDLPLPIAGCYLHCRCDHREAEYEDMTNAEKFWETFGLIQKNPDEPIVLDKIWLEGKYIKP